MTFASFLTENLSEAWLHGALSWDDMMLRLVLAQLGVVVPR